MINYINPNQARVLLGVLSAITTLAILALFYLTPLARSKMWTIIVTPLASIIGSGFLVVAPLLYDDFGSSAMLAIVTINLYALAVGWVMHTNIHLFEPILENAHGGRFLLGTERLSNWSLGISYVISVAFYISLLSAFALELFDLRQPLYVRGLTTILLATIGIYGYLKDLHGLEKLEKIAVNFKLAIIGALMVVLVGASISQMLNGSTPDALPDVGLGLHGLQVLGGMLLITQGFETARYLGKDYTRSERSRAMLYAQLIAATVYVLFVFLAQPFSGAIYEVNETAIIQLVGSLAFGAAAGLSVAAIFSQFGAGVADTVGTGGIVEEETRGRIPRRAGYLTVCALSIVLIWIFDIFQVLTLASRTFALYYALQAIIATVVMARQPPGTSYRLVKMIFFPVLAVSLLLVAIFAIPAH